MTRILIGVLILAAVATAGDYVWYEFGVRHRMWVGIFHGAALLTAVGGVIGAFSGRLIAGLPIGTIAGVVGALIYYALAPLLHQASMVIAWASLWVVLALLDGRIVRRERRTTSLSLAHGLTAAVLSGVTFYLVVGILWGRAPTGGRNYLIQFAAWAIAWAPGIFAIALDFKDARRRTA